jgi:hypothetical protein
MEIEFKKECDGSHVTKQSIFLPEKSNGGTFSKMGNRN